jgi:hypothetical protein
MNERKKKVFFNTTSDSFEKSIKRNQKQSFLFPAT